MGHPIKEKAKHLSAVLAFEQPRLTVSLTESGLLVMGVFDLKPRKPELSHLGKLDEFSIILELPKNFPKGEPKLFETAGRIPQVSSRHINPDGSCCFGIWEAWSALADPVTFQKFLDGPVQDFFFGQHYYEQHNRWPYGEYEHGKDGLLQSYAKVLGCKPKAETIRYRLRLFSNAWPKGHWKCVCGSGHRIRECCNELHTEPPVSAKSAQAMKRRFDCYFGMKSSRTTTSTTNPSGSGIITSIKP